MVTGQRLLHRRRAGGEGGVAHGSPPGVAAASSPRPVPDIATTGPLPTLSVPSSQSLPTFLPRLDGTCNDDKEGVGLDRAVEPEGPKPLRVTLPQFCLQVFPLENQLPARDGEGKEP